MTLTVLATTRKVRTFLLPLTLGALDFWIRAWAVHCRIVTCSARTTTVCAFPRAKAPARNLVISIPRPKITTSFRVHCMGSKYNASISRVFMRKGKRLALFSNVCVRLNSCFCNVSYVCHLQTITRCICNLMLH
jgi:hypothetical protein